MPCGRLSWLLVRFWAHVNIVVGWLVGRVIRVFSAGYFTPLEPSALIKTAKLLLRLGRSLRNDLRALVTMTLLLTSTNRVTLSSRIVVDTLLLCLSTSCRNAAYTGTVSSPPNTAPITRTKWEKKVRRSRETARRSALYCPCFHFWFFWKSVNVVTSIHVSLYINFILLLDLDWLSTGTQGHVGYKLSPRTNCCPMIIKPMLIMRHFWACALNMHTLENWRVVVAWFTAPHVTLKEIINEKK